MITFLCYGNHLTKHVYMYDAKPTRCRDNIVTILKLQIRNDHQTFYFTINFISKSHKNFKA